MFEMRTQFGAILWRQPGDLVLNLLQAHEL